MLYHGSSTLEHSILTSAKSPAYSSVCGKMFSGVKSQNFVKIYRIAGMSRYRAL